MLVVAAVIYWIRHAHGTHNLAQENAEEKFANENPGTEWLGTQDEVSPQTIRQLLMNRPVISRPILTGCLCSQWRKLDDDAKDGFRKAASLRREAVWAALNSGHVDADLTPKGVSRFAIACDVEVCSEGGACGFQVDQVEELRPKAQAMVEGGVQLVVSSSMRRTLKTATGAFGSTGLSFVGIDEIREVAGTFDCERRRPLQEIIGEQAEQGQFVDFASCSAVDEYWVQERDLATAQALERAVSGKPLSTAERIDPLRSVFRLHFSCRAVSDRPHFLFGVRAALDVIAARPEQKIAVVSHGATMGVLFSGSHPRVACNIDPPRQNCEVVATVLTHDPASAPANRRCVCGCWRCWSDRL